jgi:hypothetical protein
MQHCNSPAFVPVSLFNRPQRTGMLLESDRDTTAVCGRLVEPWLRVQRAGRGLARHPPLREGCPTRPKLPRRLHKPGQCAQGGAHFRSVRN